jgi:hypothetical protein
MEWLTIKGIRNSDNLAIPSPPKAHAARLWWEQVQSGEIPLANGPVPWWEGGGDDAA